MIHRAVNFLDEGSQRLAVWLGKKRLDRMYAKVPTLAVAGEDRSGALKQLLIGKGWDKTKPDENVWIFAIKRASDICDYFGVPVENSKIVRKLAEIHHGCGDMKDLDYFRNRLIGCFEPTFSIFAMLIYSGDIKREEAALVVKSMPEEDTLALLRIRGLSRTNHLLGI